MWRSSRANAAARIEAISATKDRQPLEIPAFLRCIANDYGSQDTDLGIVLIRLVTQVKEAITLHGDAKLLERHAAIWRQPPPLRALLQGLMDLGATLSQAWPIDTLSSISPCSSGRSDAGLPPAGGMPFQQFGVAV